MILQLFQFISSLILACLGLRITRFEVPSLVSPGQSATLVCLFDLGSEALYSVKWYRDSREFFRYFPSMQPAYMAFPAPGIDIDVQRSTWSHVHLRNLSVSSEGRYTCQVSADEPYFGCVQEHRHVLVYVPPDSHPRIYGEVNELGDNLTVRCSSAKSRPAANLSWYVNDVLMDTGDIVEVVRHSDHLESASSYLHLPLTSLQDDVIRVTCSASVADVIRTSSEELLVSRPREKVLELKNCGPGPQMNALIMVALLGICVWSTIALERVS
ncbi:hypothetical protein JTE90_025657 [Oedothorax gibbosus]|uniref:Ig-like domain-containing protein n=1 Tax=Oedothorax gibbosus TaxID=931172 RepID=A0AAV6TYJ8_9ARAC|nr:hypothetical protein JTE90_025657 [Oedothorax gibbosus]